MRRLMMMRNEKGMAMSTVIIVGFILMSMTGATMRYAVAEMDISRHDQDWNAALAAAEAGIDDYIFRVNNDNGYWALGNGDTANPAMTSWKTIPGSANEGRFTYTVDTSHIGLDGSIDITSSGRVDDAVRTVQASVRPRHFLDFLYFTDYETIDPIVYPILYGISESWANDNCVKYKFGSPPRDDDSGPGSYCRDIQFAAGDVIKGPLHSNDAILVGANVSGSAAEFRGNVTTNWAGVPDGSTTRRWWYNGSKPDPFFARAGDPRFASNIEMPIAVTELRSKALPSNGGCVYQGPTRIVLNSGGTMTVTSPLTPVGTGFCTVGSNRPLPANGVVYVDNVVTGPGIPNPPFNNNRCLSGGRNRLGYPNSGDLTDYECSTGDVFLKGQLKGRLTIAAKNRLVIVDDTTYATSDSLLGLIAENTVEIYHPVDCTSASSSCDMARSSADGGGFFNDATVHAAILSLTHSFYVQNFTRGDRDNLDDLIVVGAIAQKFRGAVGTSGGNSTGYLKDYTYDQRLKYISPPEFLDPVNSAWQVGTWAEVQPNATHKAR